MWRAFLSRNIETQRPRPASQECFSGPHGQAAAELGHSSRRGLGGEARSAEAACATLPDGRVVRAGDSVMYRQMGGQAMVVRVVVEQIGTDVPSGEEPMVAVRMPNGTVRDTMVGRLRAAAAEEEEEEEEGSKPPPVLGTPDRSPELSHSALGAGVSPIGARPLIYHAAPVPPTHHT
jgi:hypothetical protein